MGGREGRRDGQVIDKYTLTCSYRWYQALLWHQKLGANDDNFLHHCN